MDGLIEEELSATHAGSFIDGVRLNKISYVDNMALLAPAIGALNELLSICERYAASHGLTIKQRK